MTTNLFFLSLRVFRSLFQLLRVRTSSLKQEEGFHEESLKLTFQYFSYDSTVCSETQTTFESGFNFREVVEEGKSFDFSTLDALE